TTYCEKTRERSQANPLGKKISNRPPTETASRVLGGSKSLSRQFNQQRRCSMALGKAIGEFSYKATSFAMTPAPGVAVTIQGNVEGPMSGEAGTGTGIGTLFVTLEPGAKSGTWRWCGMGFFGNAGNVGAEGHGTWEESGETA